MQIQKHMQVQLKHPAKFLADLIIEKKQELPGEDGELKWVVEGNAIVAENVDEQLDRIEKGALAKAVDYLKKYTTVLFNHNPDHPIGKILDAAVRGSMIWVKVQISKSEEVLWNKICEGIVNSFSLSGEIDEFAYEYDKAMKAQIRVIKAFRVHEVSLVSVPANPEAKTLNAYISKSLDDAGYKEPPNGKEGTNKSFYEFLAIGMEVVKAMDWKEKLNKAIKAVGDVAAKIEDTDIRDALREIQKLLTDVATEVPAQYPPADPQQKAVVEQALGKLAAIEQKITELEGDHQSVKAKIGEFEKNFGEIDEVLGGMNDMLKNLSGSAGGAGGAGGIGGE